MNRPAVESGPAASDLPALRRRALRWPCLASLGLLLLACAKPGPSNHAQNTPAHEPAPAWIGRIIAPVWPKGQPDYRLMVGQRPPPEDADLRSFLRLMAECNCLGLGGLVPDEVLAGARPNPRFLELHSAAEREALTIAAELRLEHRDDPSLMVPPDATVGYYDGLNEDLASRLQETEAKQALDRYLWHSHLRHRDDPTSCAIRAGAYLQALMQERSGPVPVGEQWRLAVDVCSGPPDSLRAHVVLRPLGPEVAPQVARAIALAMADPRFHECLVAVLERDPAVAERVLRLDGLESHAEQEATREAAQAAWAASGLPEALEATGLAGELAPEFEGWLTSCGEAGFR